MEGCLQWLHLLLLYSLFSCLEAACVLDPDNELDIVALHHTYLPWIQHQLDIFKETWSQHKLRSCGSRSPLEMWIMGFLAGNQGEPAARSGISPAAPQRTQEAISAMGFDPNFFANVNAVEVPELNVSIDEGIQEILQDQLNPSNYPVSECDELYLSVRMFLHEALTPSA